MCGLQPSLLTAAEVAAQDGLSRRWMYQAELAEAGARPLGYGAFCATEDGEPVNPRTHLSAVIAVLSRDRYAAWQLADRERFIGDIGPVDEDDYDERIARHRACLKTPIGRNEVEGPTVHDFQVTVYDLNGYGLGHGPPIPAGWFDGPRDKRYRFDATGANFGPTRNVFLRSTEFLASFWAS